MKTGMLLAALAAAGLIGGVVLLASGDPDPAPGSARTARASVPADQDRARLSVDDRVAELEQRVEDIERELRLVRMRGAAVPHRGLADEDPSSEAGAADPALEASVREILAAERERERDAESERRRERWQSRSNEILDELVRRVHIDATQRERLAELWNGEREQLAELFAGAREGEADFRALRQQARALRTSTDEQAQAILDAEQLEAYEELRPRGGRGEGRGEGRGPRGDGE
jgi:hypothetical protein